MSTNRRAGIIPQDQLPRGPAGRCLCRWCQKEVPKHRRTFCSEACNHEFQVRRSPHYARRVVGKRDKGVCAECKCDTKFLRRVFAWAHWFSETPDRNPGEHLRSNANRAPSWLKTLWREMGFRDLWDRNLGQIWQADHIVPVIEGGGECGEQGLRTLCSPCHKKATRELHTRLKEKRRGPNLFTSARRHATA